MFFLWASPFAHPYHIQGLFPACSVSFTGRTRPARFVYLRCGPGLRLVLLTSLRGNASVPDADNPYFYPFIIISLSEMKLSTLKLRHSLLKVRRLTSKVQTCTSKHRNCSSELRISTSELQSRTSKRRLQSFRPRRCISELRF